VPLVPSRPKKFDPRCLVWRRLGLFIYMEEDSDSLEHTARILSERTTDRTLERIARGLESNFPLVRHLTDDAVAEAVERTLSHARRKDIADPLGFTYVVARNSLRRAAKNRDQSQLGEDALAELSSPPFEDGVVSEIELDRIRAGVKSWPNENIRTVMLVVIDAAREGIYLSLIEITEAASAALGRSLEAGSVKTWKRRGIKALAAQFNLTLDDEEESS
jgi:hypothetical protein